jgi:hypothetical protein
MKVYNLSSEHKPAPSHTFTVCTITDTASAATLTNIDSDKHSHVLVTVEGGDGRVRFDGTAPTTSVGHPVYSGTSFTWPVAMLMVASFIRSGSTSMSLSITPLTY